MKFAARPNRGSTAASSVLPLDVTTIFITNLPFY
jgi:hypothetical protein